MRYREEAGTVTELRNEEALIQLDPGSEQRCRSCCAGCSTAASGARILKVQRGDLREHDRVRVEIPAHSMYLSILLVFVTPMVLFVGGIALGIKLESGGGGHGMLPIIGGVLGLALAFVIAWLAERKISTSAEIEVQRLSGESR